MTLLKKNIFFNALLSISQIIFPLLTFPYASRILGPQVIGAVSFADNFTSYFLIFSALGIPLYGVREIAKVKDDKKKLGEVFSELLSIHIVISIFSIGLLFLISNINQRMYSNIDLYYVSMCIIMGSVFIAEWFFQGVNEFRFIAVRTVLIRVVTIGLLFLLVHSEADKVIYYGLNLVAVIISAVVNMTIISRKIAIRFTWRWSILNKHFSPLFIIFSNSMITSVYLFFDTIILGFLTDDIRVGFYSAAMRISKLSMVIIGVLGAVLLPKLTLAFHNKDFEEARTLVSKSLDFVIFISVPIAIGMFCLSKEIITLFAGSKYEEAVLPLRLLCFIVFFIGIAQVFSLQILLPLHEERKILKASIVGMIVSLTLNFSLIPFFKEIGAAISSLTTEIVVTVLLFFFIKNTFKIVFPFKSVFRAVVTCAVFFLFKYLAHSITQVNLIVIFLTVLPSAIFYVLFQALVWKNKNIFDLLTQYGVFKFLSIEKK